jgi:polyisoprenyl-teichoic acid--peptidoglycan teichoic acid transferase
VNTLSSDENLSFGEKVVLCLLGGAGLLVWAIVTLFAMSGRGFTDRAYAMPPPVVRASATSTDAIVVSPTATPSPTVDFTPTLMPTPTLTPVPTTMPSGVSMLPIDGDIQVIALLGIDEKHNAAVWRTDSIILAFVDRKARRLSLLSVPRDMWVRIPGYASNRINTVDALGARTNYPGGGVALLDQTLRFNLGIPVHNYVRIDFHGFVRIVNALGGVTVDVKKPLTDTFPDPTSPSGWAWITLNPGVRHMDGRMALSYCRSRVTSSDFDRSTRQQQIMFAVWRKALTLDALARAPQLWTEFSDAIETDLSITSAVQLAYFVQGLDPDAVRNEHIDNRLVRPWTTALGAQVLLPETEDIRRLTLDLVVPAP